MWQVYGPFNSVNGFFKMTARRGSQVVVADGLTAVQIESFDPQVHWDRTSRSAPLLGSVSA